MHGREGLGGYGGWRMKGGLKVRVRSKGVLEDRAERTGK